MGNYRKRELVSRVDDTIKSGMFDLKKIPPGALTLPSGGLTLPPGGLI
jgi:hypothetical protein